MKPIGGYFSLELAHRAGWPFDGELLNTGRNALEYVLGTLDDVSMLHIPYYTCGVVMEPIEKLGIPYRRYRIDENLEIADSMELGAGAYILYTNYFGIKDAYCGRLAKEYGNNLIIDNAQALFSLTAECAGTIYSFRKFIGVPDGGMACLGKGRQCIRGVSEDMGQDVSFGRCSHLLKRIDIGAEGGYGDFRANDEKLCNNPVRRMSALTRTLLGSIDFEWVKSRRWRNFRQLHEALGSTNLLQIPDFSTFACPMVYPYFTEDPDLKNRLIANRIFVATYWPNVFEWCSHEDLEYQLAGRCLAIPVDQRYGEEEMQHIIETIKPEI